MMPIDLGDGHFLEWMAFAPNRELNPKYADLPDNDRVGAFIHHKKPDGSECLGSIHFDCPQMHAVLPGRAVWTVESWEPLTVKPSIQCSCGDHGHIINGKWVKA